VAPTKYRRVAEMLRDQVTGSALARETGYSTITCRRTLKTLIADGMLAPDPATRELRTATPPAETSSHGDPG
jgi:DNA-binding IclR family transcriptional regulator